MRSPRVNMRSAVRIGLIVLLVLAMTACNYRFGGYRETRGAIQSVNIPPLENQTRQVGIEALFTNDLVYEIGRGNRIALAGPDRADAVIKGVIKNLKADTIARQSLNTALERRVYVTVELTVKDRKGRLVWRQSLTDNEAYFVQPDKVSTEGDLRKALMAISRRIAEKFHYRFTQEF